MQWNVAMAIVCLTTATVVVGAQAPTLSATQTAMARRKQSKKVPFSSIEVQIQQMHAELQGEIDQLRAQLAEKDAEIAALQQKNQDGQAMAAASAAQVGKVDGGLRQAAVGVNDIEVSVVKVQPQNALVVSSVEQVKKSQTELAKSADAPAALRYKGIMIVPGGYLAAESIWRQRAMNADIYTNYNATPYMNSGDAHISEWVPSARQSRISTLFSGKVPFGTIKGYFEGDFLSAGTTSNNLQSNSYTLRVRQAWGQASFGHLKLTAGQMWTLLMENKQSTDPGQERAPLFFDANLHVGDSYIRQTGFRLQDAFTPKVTVAVALENSQYQFSASNAPTNFFFGSAGAGGGLNNPTANYTNQVAPDVVVKAAFDPGYGHYELGGVVRLFRDRYYLTGGAAAVNDTRVGGGFVANARFPVARKLDVGLHLVAGDGTGRYGVSLLPDVTVRPNGTLSPLRNAQGLLSLEFHPTKKLDLFGYSGVEYAQRTFYHSATGTLVGYAPPTANNTGCNVEADPTSGSGFAPGSGACLGATRVILQNSVGWIYHIYNGPAGALQYGAAYSYLTRSGWAGVGGAPKATNNFVYTSFRYYLP